MIIDKVKKHECYHTKIPSRKMGNSILNKITEEVFLDVPILNYR